VRFKTTLVLILILAGIWLAIQMSEDEEAPPPEPPRSFLFPGLFFNGLQRIELCMNVGRKAVLERDESGRWMVLEPYADVAREDRLNQLFGIIHQNLRKRVSSEGEQVDLESKGLAVPARSIVLHDGKKVHRVNIGVKDAMGSEVFVTFDDEDVLYTTGANIWNFLDMNPEDLRDKRLFRIDPLIVNSVRIEGPDGVIVDGVRKLRQWEIVAPVKDDGESSGFLSLINRLCRFKVGSILPLGEDPETEKEEYGFNEGWYRFTLRSGPLAESVVVAPKVLGPQGAVFCMRDGEETVLTINRLRFAKVALDLESYRSRTLFPEVREDVKGVTVRRKGKTWLSLRKDKGQYFSMNDPFEALADNVEDGDITPVSLFITTVFSLRASDFVTHEADDLEEFGLKEPEWEVEVRWRPDPRAREKNVKVAFSDPAHGYRMVCRRDKPRFVYSIKADDLRFLYDDPLLLRDRRIFYQKIEYVTGARFVLGEKECMIRRNSSGVFEDDPDQRFQAFLHDLKRVMVTRYEVYEGGIKPEPDPRFDAPLGSVHWIVDEPGRQPREIVAEFGSGIVNGFHGRTSDMDRGLFILETDFIESFKKLFGGL